MKTYQAIYKNIYKILILTMGLLLTQPALAHQAHMQHGADALFVSVVFDAQGVLWRAGVKDGFVMVDKSPDLGKTFSKAVKVNSESQNIGSNGQARPKIALDKQGNIYVTWTQNLKTLYASYVWFSRSINSGKSFEKPLIVHQDRGDFTHAFDNLNVSESNITVTWIDGRDAILAKNSGKAHMGLSIYYAVSTDLGKSFSREKKLADNSCECCRITTTSKPDGTVVAMWRHVFEGSERDHMMAEIPQADAKVDLHRATFGRWKVDGCPHHGAALATGGEGKDWWGYHMAYFDGNDKNKAGSGLYYSRMDGVAWASSVPKKFGNAKNQAAHPAILSVGEKVWLVWRETEAKNNAIVGIFSDDGGRNWSDTKTLATTVDKADYPQLLKNVKDNQVYLAWNTAKEGLRVFNLKDFF